MRLRCRKAEEFSAHSGKEASLQVVFKTGRLWLPVPNSLHLPNLGHCSSAPMPPQL